MAELNKCKRQCIVTQGLLTRKAGNIRTLIMQGDQCNVKELQTNLEVMYERLSRYQEAQLELSMVLPEEEVEASIDTSEAYLENILRCRLEAEALLSELQANSTKEDESSKDMASSTGNSATGTNVKLEKLKQPSFSGKVEDWVPFWEQFESNVHNNEGLNDVTKFSYLKNLLKAEAKQAVDGLQLSGLNYTKAVQILKDRFGRKEAIIFHHVQALLNLKLNGADQGSTSALRKLQEQLLIHVRSLETLGVEGDAYGVILTPVVLSRLPANVRLEWTKNGIGKEGDLSFLLSFLEEEVQRHEIADAFSSSCSVVHTEKKKTYHYSKPKPNMSTGVALTVKAKVDSEPCIFCERVHKGERCKEVIPVDRRWDIVRQKHRCFACLKDHRTVDNKCTSRCSHCKGRHHILLCHKHEQSSGSQSASVRPNDTVQSLAEPQANVSLVNLEQCNNICTAFQTAKVLVGSGRNQVEATILFDSASDKSYISQNLVDKVGGRFVKSCNITYANFGGSQVSNLRNVYQFSAQSAYHSGDKLDLTAICVPTITVPLCKLKIPDAVVHKIGNLKMADNVTTNRKVNIDILIGLDQYWSVMKPGTLSLTESLVALDSKFGWVLSGSFGSKENTSDTDVHFANLAHTLFTLTTVTDVSDTELKQFWDLESIGIVPKEDMTHDCETLREFEQKIRFDSDENRYVVQLPWKSNADQLCDNYRSTAVRYGKLKYKLDQDANLKKRYENAMCEMENLNFIERVDVQETTENRVFYLPHRPVVRESSTTTKVRPVFDASARGPNGVSLNNVVDQGPNLLPNLLHVLLRFRRWRFALSADITKAFLQILIDPQDRDVHRFLWNDLVYRFRRVTFGVNASPFLLNATIRYHLKQYPESVATRELRENLYVDDLLSGADDHDDLMALFGESSRMLSEAGMVLCKWKSNHTLFRDKLTDGQSGHKVLGIGWSPDSDVFSFQGFDLPDGLVGTKRVVLSCVARLYDPLGLVSPFVMTLKILFQKIWMLGLDWDQLLPADLQSEFCEWCEGLDVLKSMRIPRAYFEDGWTLCVDELEMHAFCDASQQGYGCVIYLKCRKLVTLVCSKARVAPVKKVTLPRLELLGALLASRMVKMVREALGLSQTTQVFCWTDSSVALGWIRGDPSRWKQFVSNRVTEIQSLTPPSCWSHCPGELNPSDLLTRGLSARTLVNSECWLKGPLWLREGKFPESDSLIDMEEELPEMSVTLVTVRQREDVLPFTRWSSFSKTLRVVGWIYRFHHNCRNKSRHQGDLTYDELSRAKVVVFSMAQVGVYASELESLQSRQSVSNSSTLFKLAPFLDDQGLIRAGSRLQLSDLSHEEKHPIILPKGHLSLLLVRHQHVLMNHAGVSTLVTSLRDSLWIVSVRPLAKQVVKSCVACRRQEARPYNAVVAPLPADRVKSVCPFSVTGVDFAGPLYVVDCPGKKFYICLYTCLVVRAVHLELVSSLNVEEFILSFKRFVARRGLPTVVWSDNARTFVSAKDRLVNLYGVLAPEWKFIVPRSPWWGGCWERMVRSVKSCLKKTLGTRVLTKDELATLLCEVESTINSRPLTFVGDTSCPQPLSPSHFLLNRRHLSPVQADTPPTDRTELIERDNLRVQLLEKFWQVWSKEYLRNLPVTVHKFHHKGNISIGSVVLVNEDNVPRMSWPLGVVERLFTSKDGIVRSVLLKTGKGLKTRAIHRLHSLEIVNDVCNSDDEVGNGDVDIEPNDVANVQSHEPEVSYTRTGRVVKPVNRLDL